MVQHRRFMDLALDDEGLHTPDGTLCLTSITRAELVRNRARSGGTATSVPSAGGIVGGAIVGGALAGPIGAVGGGLLGSTMRRDSTEPCIPRTVSASLIFESRELAYSTTVGRDRVAEAEAFVAAVKTAAGI